MAPAAGSATHLHLIRHAATATNEQTPYVLQGSGTDPPLSPNGRKQAAAVAQFMARFPIVRIYSSPLRRAVDSARMIGRVHDLSVATLERLVECNVGQWEGLSWESIQQLFPVDYTNFIHDPVNLPYPDGESFGDVFRRTQPVFEQLLLQHPGEHIVVVAHGVVNRVYLSHLLGLDMRRARSVPQENGCANLICHGRGETRVVTLNSVYHLARLAA
jgi:broad specificity phosphatase PhoE